jgi:hypothetical protein
MTGLLPNISCENHGKHVRHRNSSVTEHISQVDSFLFCKYRSINYIFLLFKMADSHKKAEIARDYHTAFSNLKL